MKEVIVMNIYKSVIDSFGQTYMKNADAENNTAVNEYTIFNPGNDSSDINKKISKNKLRSIQDFKDAADTIELKRKDAKKQVNLLTKNIYSMINQINFSIKLILDTNNYLTRYTTNETNLKEKLESLLTVDDTEVYMSMYNNITFNNLFIKDILYFENFTKILQEAVSDYLISNGDIASYTITTEEIFSQYCKKFYIQNNWNLIKDAYNKFLSVYDPVFTISNITQTPSDSQETLIEEYNQYVNSINYLKIIFDPILAGYTTNAFTYDYVDDNTPNISNTLINAIQGLISFKTDSTLYTRYLDKIETILDETQSLFIRLFNYGDKLINYNVEYQEDFKDNNIYLTGTMDTCSVATDIISSLILMYPNRNAKANLITDDNFTRLLTIINNLYTREITTMGRLIDVISRDYKLISSLETFLTTENSIDNAVLFSIMENFDTDLSIPFDDETNMTQNGSLQIFNFESLVRGYLHGFNNEDSQKRGRSYTKVLIDNSFLLNPMYDILNYYRLFLFSFTKGTSVNDVSLNDVSLIFNLLETFYLFNVRLTKPEFNSVMDKLFDIKINNIDYININKSKLNESISSLFPELDRLNYFDITPYTNIVKDTNLSTIADIDDLTTLFENLTGYDLILFTIIENILYNNIDLSLVMKTLSIKLNIRTVFMKLMFAIAINVAKGIIETYYSNDVPDSLTIYNDLELISLDITDDLDYLNLLLTANEYYKGENDLFNIDTITDFTVDGTNI